LGHEQLLDTALTSAALRMAINQRHYSQNLIVHSDRGAQFASAAYRQLLSQHGLTASPRSLKLVPPSSTTSKPSITASDFTPALPTKPQSVLNPN
jgi:hypothetical protein